jgi:hypothetical protein
MIRALARATPAAKPDHWPSREESMMKRRVLGVCALAVGFLGVSAAIAVATPPGTNGQIAWQRETTNAPPDLWVANADGSQARVVFAGEDAPTFEAAFSPVNAARSLSRAGQRGLSPKRSSWATSPRGRCAR